MKYKVHIIVAEKQNPSQNLVSLGSAFSLCPKQVEWKEKEESANGQPPRF